MGFKKIHSIQVKKSIEQLSWQKLIKQIYHLDLEARFACISFLPKQYPVIFRKQVEKLIHLIFENNFKFYLRDQTLGFFRSQIKAKLQQSEALSAETVEVLGKALAS